MNSLSAGRLIDLHLIYEALNAIYNETHEDWSSLSQEELFGMAMKRIGKKVNPSALQTAIEQLEKFQLPRNVQEQEHCNVEI